MFSVFIRAAPSLAHYSGHLSLPVMVSAPMVFLISFARVGFSILTDNANYHMEPPSVLSKQFCPSPDAMIRINFPNGAVISPCRIGLQTGICITK
jgi:hypothetical protein